MCIKLAQQNIYSCSACNCTPSTFVSKDSHCQAIPQRISLAGLFWQPRCLFAEEERKTPCRGTGYGARIHTLIDRDMHKCLHVHRPAHKLLYCSTHARMHAHTHTHTLLPWSVIRQQDFGVLAELCARDLNKMPAWPQCYITAPLTHNTVCLSKCLHFWTVLLYCAFYIISFSCSAQR